jgi:hypothetical protein
MNDKDGSNRLYDDQVQSREDSPSGTHAILAFLDVSVGAGTRQQGNNAFFIVRSDHGKLAVQLLGRAVNSSLFFSFMHKKMIKRKKKETANTPTRVKD